ncbi:hypothetical protein KR009_004070 [Drosophila setifemur]|nr:hypothetical protein KR009_004070 [Drosophila setifemur]
MIHLRRPVIFNIYKQPACLPLEDGNRNPVFVAIGWGQHSVSSFHQSKWLIQVDLHNFGSTCVTSITPNDDLPEGYKGESQLCVGSQEHKDTCNGDSGGPLLIPHPGNGCVHQVMGITSFGIGCDTPGTPGVYTRVYHYLDWIRRELGKSQ